MACFLLKNTKEGFEELNGSDLLPFYGQKTDVSKNILFCVEQIKQRNKERKKESQSKFWNNRRMTELQFFWMNYPFNIYEIIVFLKINFNNISKSTFVVMYNRVWLSFLKKLSKQAIT